jgi:subtilisin-like proprotein convertase family protein
VVIYDNTTADPYPAAIQVSGFKKGKVIDVNVVLRGLNHGFPDHIDAVLMAPSGAAAVLMSDAGGSADAASLTLTLDDEAAAALPDGSGLATGAYKPGNYGAADTYPSLGTSPTAAILSLLDGGNPNGEWRLYVVDDAATNVGAFSGGWDLELTVKLAKKKHGHGGKK